MERMDLATYLKQWRRGRNLSLRAAGEHFGLHHQTVASIENRTNGMLTPATLNALAVGLELPLLRIMELYGIESGLPSNLDGEVQRIIAMSKTFPDLAEILHHLPEMTEEEARFVRTYLEHVARARRTE